MAERKTKSFPVDEETYNTLILLVKKQFSVPVKNRTLTQKNAVIKFWRNKDRFSVKRIGVTDKLFRDGKEVLKLEKLKAAVVKQFKTAKGCGARAINYKLKGIFSATGEKRVLKILQSSKAHQKLNPKFRNKPELRPVVSHFIFEKIQVDLIDMSRAKVRVGQKEYRYILSVIDVFSRYVFLRPLQRKRSKCVAKELKKIFAEHGYPKILQADRGTEFRGEVLSLLKANGTKIITSRPYHPQSQGKCERLNKTVKSKLRYIGNTSGNKGYNWVEKLQEVANSINNSPKEVLGYYTPFQVFFQRSFEINVHCPKDVREKAAKASKRCRTRMVLRQRSADPVSNYEKGERVLIKFPTNRGAIPRKRKIIPAVVVGRKGFMYRILFKSDEKRVVKKWISVEHITSETQAKENRKKADALEKEHEKRKKRLHRKKFYITKSTADRKRHERKSNRKRLQMQRGKFFIVKTHTDNLHELTSYNDVHITFDPAGDGDCQFAAVADQLNTLGIYKSVQDLRQEAVDHIQSFKDFYIGYIYNETFDNYIDRMRQNGTFGDHLTLTALAREYNVQMYVHSTRGPESNRLISNSSILNNIQPLLHLGYFPEGAGEHYVSVSLNTQRIPEELNDLDDINNLELDNHITYSSDKINTENGNLSEETQSADENVDRTHNNSDTDSLAESLNDLDYVNNSELDKHITYSSDKINTENGNLSEETQSADENVDRPHNNSDTDSLAESLNDLDDVYNSELDNHITYSSDEIDTENGNLSEETQSASENVDRTDNSDTDILPEALNDKNDSNSETETNSFTVREQEIAPSFTDLPPLVLDKIFRMCFADDPLLVFTLKKVCRYFLEILRTANPKLYISECSLPSVPNVISVMRLIKVAGKSSGLILNIKSIFRNKSNWANAWLSLKELENRWFEIENIWWKRK